MKRDRELTNKKAELVKIDEQIRELSQNIGGMSHIPRYDEKYSAAKMDNWQRDLAKLEEKRTELIVKMEELSKDPERRQEIDKLRIGLVAKQNRIRDERDKLKKQFTESRYAMPEKVAMGEDPLVLSEELYQMGKRIEALTRALEVTTGGLDYLNKL